MFRKKKKNNTIIFDFDDGDDADDNYGVHKKKIKRQKHKLLYILIIHLNMQHIK